MSEVTEVTAAPVSTILDVVGIQRLLPHRPPFLLVDRVVEFEEYKRLVAWKGVTMNEPFFTGHFPGHPVMPGVLILEALAQAGALLAIMSLGPSAADKSPTSWGLTARSSASRWCPEIASSCTSR